MVIKFFKWWTPFRRIIFGFFLVCIVGGLLLSLPISSNQHIKTPFIDALFTSTSAVCVTGLIVRDTGSYWSLFGKSVILILIQIGGLGVITILGILTIISHKTISLSQRNTIKEAIASPQVGGVLRSITNIVKNTLLIEIIGAIVLSVVFVKDFGIKGIYFSIFHSVSAFCNAGFDLLGTNNNKFCSLVNYKDNVIINICIMTLIIVGGIGFAVWEDIKNYGVNFKKYKTQSKIAITTSLILIILPAIFFFLIDFNKLNIKSGILYSLFQSVTTRTAGFNTVDLNNMSTISISVMIILMLIGGSPGSTAGGMKTTTFAILISNMFTTFNKKDDVEMFRRRLDVSIVKNATAIFMLYLLLFLTSSFVVSIIEGLPLKEIFFEVASALGTVGITLGITTKLCNSSKIILMILMFIGRVGGLTLIYATKSNNQNVAMKKLPLDNVAIG